jgi:probable phosphoglycerate mutase
MYPQPVPDETQTDGMSAAQLWVVRHGATEWTRDGRHTSDTDVPLRPEGERAAAELRSRLARRPFASILTSPRMRARETARLAGFPDAEIDDDLSEWRYGDYEGLTTPEIRRMQPGWTIWDGPTPGGESPDEVAARVGRVLSRAEDAGGDVLLFGHGHLLRALTAVALGFTVRDGARFVLDPGAIGVVGHEHEYRSLRAWNIGGAELPSA